jgi:hypothetical protein
VAAATRWTAKRRKPISSTIGDVPTPRSTGESGYVNYPQRANVSRLKPLEE